MQTYQTGFKTTLALKMEAADTTMTVAIAPTVTAGRLKIGTGSNSEWVSYTGVSGTMLTGLTRGLSKTTNPATAGTGTTHIAGTMVKLVAMHDQLTDRQQATQYTGDLGVGGNMTVTGSETVNGLSTHNAPVVIAGSTSYLQLPQLTTVQRLALTPSNGFMVYDSTLGLMYQYKGGAWANIDTGTPTGNATTTIAGSVELSTQAETDALTTIGGTGASLVTQQDYIPTTEDTTIAPLNMFVEYDSTSSNNKKKVRGQSIVDVVKFGDGSDGDVTVTTTITLTRDMFYNNITVTSPGIINTDGFKIYYRGTLSGNGTIRALGNVGGNASGTTGGTAGVAPNSGTLNAAIAGVAGTSASGAGAGGSIGGPGVSTNPTYTNSNGVAGGAAGSGTGGGTLTGGIAGTSTRGVLYNIFYNPSKALALLVLPTLGVTVLAAYKTAASSGSGAAGPGNGGFGNGGGGGGSGTPGNMIFLSGFITNFTGILDVTGGIGGNGGISSVAGTGTGGGGGGGGGGNGGIIYIATRTATSIGTTTIAGGAGGTGGLGGNGGGTGSTGTTGNSGVVIQQSI